MKLLSCTGDKLDRPTSRVIQIRSVQDIQPEVGINNTNKLVKIVLEYVELKKTLHIYKITTDRPVLLVYFSSSFDRRILIRWMKLDLFFLSH